MTITGNTPDEWDYRLVEAFGTLINEDGWLTSDWHQHLEDNFTDWDKNGNDTNEKKDLYSLMYNLEFEETEDRKFIRPIVQRKTDIAPKRLFVVNEEINHKKYGLGKVKEVFDNKITITFYDGEEKKILTHLFENNII